MRLALTADIPALTALWETCFGDPPELIHSFWDRMWEEITVFTNEDCTAMATAMPVRWQGKRAAYLYAIATDPAHQGKGLCRRLMAEAEAYLQELDCAYAILCPAEEHLFRLYEKLGYETCFFCERKNFQRTDSILPVEEVSPETYADLRRKFGPDGVEYPPSLLALQAAAGPLLEITDIGCAAAERTNAGWILRELLSEDPETTASSLCYYLNVPLLPAKLPGDLPYGMAKSLDGTPLPASYLGLAFE